MISIAMKKTIFPLILLVCLVFSFVACFHFHDTTISAKDNEGRYRFKAKFERRETYRIKQYLQSVLRNEYDAYASRNGNIDADVVLDDNTRFYLYARPGILLIDMDKEENSGSSRERVKAIGEDIKSLLSNR